MISRIELRVLTARGAVITGGEGLQYELVCMRCLECCIDELTSTSREMSLLQK